LKEIDQRRLVGFQFVGKMGYGLGKKTLHSVTLEPQNPSGSSNGFE
jgi:hypothetical protein